MKRAMLSVTCLALMLQSAAAQKVWDFSVISDIESYFDRTLKGQSFSAVGKVEKIQKSSRLFSRYWYLQVQGTGANEANKVYCVIAANEQDPKLAQARKAFPIDAQVRMSGPMLEYVRWDSTVRLDDYCKIERVK